MDYFNSIVEMTENAPQIRRDKAITIIHSHIELAAKKGWYSTDIPSGIMLSMVAPIGPKDLQYIIKQLRAEGFVVQTPPNSPWNLHISWNVVK